MHYDITTILEACGLCCVAMWLVGFPMLMIAARKAGREFRVKGYLRRPSGSDWFPFVLKKRYDAFENPTARFCFGMCHACMLIGLVVFCAGAVLLGCSLLLKLLSSTP